MSKNQPNRFLAPIVIAGVTIGFLASAYKFIFAHSKKNQDPAPELKSNPKNVVQTGSDQALDHAPDDSVQ